MALKLFINKLPSEPKLILQARNQSDFRKAKRVLIDTDNFYQTFPSNTQIKLSNFHQNRPNHNFRNFRLEHPQNNQQRFQRSVQLNSGDFVQNRFKNRRADNSGSYRNHNHQNNRLFSGNFGTSPSNNFSQRPSTSSFSRNSNRSSNRVMEVNHIQRNFQLVYLHKTRKISTINSFKIFSQPLQNSSQHNS